MDPQKLGLTDKLVEVVMGEAEACGTRQPVVIAGDLNAHPVVIPAATTAISSGLFVGLEKAYALVKGESPFRSLSRSRLGSCIGGPILMWMLILRGGPGALMLGGVWCLLEDSRRARASRVASPSGRGIVL